MLIKGLIEEDFTNYKKASMFISTSKCDFKCCKECGKGVCQNISLIENKSVDMSDDFLIKRYLDNPITKAIVIGGLEPFDTFEEVCKFIDKIRNGYNCHDDIVIYSGYYPDEISGKIAYLSKYDNIIVKFGRYIPDRSSKADDLLGVDLASDNQYAKKIG